MLNDKQIKQLPTIEMIRCEVSGELVPITDCEVVIIKIIKSKKASLKGFNPFGSKLNQSSNINREVNIDNIPIPPPLDRPLRQQKRSVIPPGVLAVMKPPGTPGSAEEIRTV